MHECKSIHKRLISVSDGACVLEMCIISHLSCENRILIFQSIIIRLYSRKQANETKFNNFVSFNFFWFNFIVDKFILHREKCRYDGRGIGRVRWG